MLLTDINRFAIVISADAVGSLLLLTRRPTFYFKEVIVLRANEKNFKKSNAIPDDALEALARCLYPMIVTFFDSDKGQREFVEWQSRKNAEELLGGMAESDEINRLAG